MALDLRYSINCYTFPDFDEKYNFLYYICQGDIFIIYVVNIVHNNSEFRISIYNLNTTIIAENYFNL